MEPKLAHWRVTLGAGAPPSPPPPLKADDMRRTNPPMREPRRPPLPPLEARDSMRARDDVSLPSVSPAEEPCPLVMKADLSLVIIVSRLICFTCSLYDLSLIHI